MHASRLLAPRARRRSWFAKLRARRDADLWLRTSLGRWDSHPAVAWRVAELTSPRERRILARSLRGIVHDVKAPRSTFSASPLNRRDLGPYVDEIAELAGVVGDLDRPVTAVGIVLVRDLLTDGGSPLYLGGTVSELPARLARIRSALTITGYPEDGSAAGGNDSGPRDGHPLSMERTGDV
jgi:hypothetical protein